MVRNIPMNTTENPAGAYADTLFQNAVEAGREFEKLGQEETDLIVTAVFKAAYNARIELAEAAIEETGIGRVDHKIEKNAWASLVVYRDIIYQKTVGLLSRDRCEGIVEFARPVGPILALTPITNPTSTIIFKTLIAMKTRNPIIFSPHRASKKCSRRTVEILTEAAMNAGAPEHAIQIARKTREPYLNEIMHHRKLSLILATGTLDIVKKAHNTGKPTLGSGPGNVPVYIDPTADLVMAAKAIIQSKTFDNGSVCSSEQALVVPLDIDAEFRTLLTREGAFFCSRNEARELIRISYDPVRNRMQPSVVGQTATAIAARAGFTVPERTRLLVTECEGIGSDYPCSQEILAPIISYYSVDNFSRALETISAVEKQGGLGHTVSVFCNSDAVISAILHQTDAGRVLVNTPSTMGAIGGLYNRITPSLTLSCGTDTGNFTVDNISIHHLLHIHRMARRRENIQWFSLPVNVFAQPNINADKILKLYDWNR